MFVKTHNGNLHQINESLFNLIENRFILLEGDDIRLMEDKPQVSGNDWLIAMLKEKNYYVDQIKDKRQRDFILQTLSNKIAENPQNSKQIIDDFVTNPDSIYNNQEQPNQNQEKNNQQEQPENKEQTKQQNQDNQTQEEPNQEENPENKKDNQPKTKEQEEQVSKTQIAAINLIKNSAQFNTILGIVNKENNTNYTSEDVPNKLLIDASEKDKEFVYDLLRKRLDAGLERVSLDKTSKEEIKNIFEEDCKRRGSIPNILNSKYVKEKNPHTNAYDFPVTKYYVEKYNKTLTRKLYQKLAEGIKEYKLSKLFKSDAIGNLLKEVDVDTNADEKTIIEAIKKKYPEELIKYIIQKNKKMGSLQDIENISADEIAESLTSDQLAGVDIINSALMVLKAAMNDNGFLPFIDYIINTNYNVKNSSDDDNNYAIKVNMFNEYGASSVSQQMRDICQQEGLPFNISSYKVKVSAFYSDISNIEFKSTENNEHCFIRFVKGFAWLERMQKSFNKGAQAGRNVRGMFSHMKR